MGPETAWFILVMYQPEVNRRSIIVGPYVDRDDVIAAMSTPHQGDLDTITEGLPCEFMAMELETERDASGKSRPIITHPIPVRTPKTEEDEEVQAEQARKDWLEEWGTGPS